MSDADARKKANIVITGTPGVGKTTHAKLLAENTGLKLLSLNDIAKEPPSFKAMPRLLRLKERSAFKHDSGKTNEANSDVNSVARKRMMELEREKAVVRYRALKQAKLKKIAKEVDEG